MLNKTKFTTLVVALLLISFSQTLKAQGEHKEFTNWPELKNFHKVISNTFHPMEEGNLEPIRARSAELNEQALKLAESKIPDDLNRPEIVSAVKELEIQTNQLNELIKGKAGDDEVKRSLTSVHDSFHKIVGLCMNDEHDDAPAEK